MESLGIIVIFVNYFPFSYGIDDHFCTFSFNRSFVFVKRRQSVIGVGTFEAIDARDSCLSFYFVTRKIEDSVKSVNLADPKVHLNIFERIFHHV